MVELEDFKYGGTSITPFRLVNPNDEKVQNVVREWIQGETWHKRQIPFAGKSIKVRNLLAGLNEKIIVALSDKKSKRPLLSYIFTINVKGIEAVFFVFLLNFQKYQEIIKLLQLSST